MIIFIGWQIGIKIAENVNPIPRTSQESSVLEEHSLHRATSRLTSSPIIHYLEIVQAFKFSILKIGQTDIPRLQWLAYSVKLMSSNITGKVFDTEKSMKFGCP